MVGLIKKRRYASRVLDQITLFRGDSRAASLSATAAYFALQRDVAEIYAKLRKSGVVKMFGLSKPIKVFVMTVPNLAKLVRDNPENAALARAVRGVTGVTAAGVVQGTYRNWNAANAVFLHLPGSNNIWLSPNTLHVHTSGWLSENNARAGVPAPHRLALEMRRVLKPLGYDGWTYHNGHFRHNGSPFHSEVMLWDAPSKVEFVMDLPILKTPKGAQNRKGARNSKKTRNPTAAPARKPTAASPVRRRPG